MQVSKLSVIQNYFVCKNQNNKFYKINNNKKYSLSISLNGNP